MHYVYALGMLFMAIYFFHGAFTGTLRRRRVRSPDPISLIPNWARLVCLVIGSLFAAAAGFAFAN